MYTTYHQECAATMIISKMANILFVQFPVPIASLNTTVVKVDFEAVSIYNKYYTTH